MSALPPRSITTTNGLVVIKPASLMIYAQRPLRASSRFCYIQLTTLVAGDFRAQASKWGKRP
jgi:hypothetical protein